MSATHVRYPQIAFPYPGSKARMMHNIVPLMPDHNHFIDVFGGSGASILGKPVCDDLETINDLDGDIINFFEVVASDDYYELVSKAARTQIHTEPLIKKSKVILNDKSNSPLDRAWAWLAITHGSQNFAHPNLRHMPFKLYRKPHTDHNKWANIPYRLACIRERFAQVQILQRDWQDVITLFSQNKKEDEVPFFFIDPPYVRSTRNSDQYRLEFSDEMHVELLDRLNDLDDLVMLCGYENELYKKKLKGWKKKKFTAKNAHNKPRTEVVWMNY